MSSTTLDTLLPLVQQLTVQDKVRLIEHLLPEIRNRLPAEHSNNENPMLRAMKASEASFDRIWNNEEDAIYDTI